MEAKYGLQLLPGTKKRLGIKVPGENRFLYIGSAILGAVIVTLFSLNRYEASLTGQVQQLNEQLVALEQKRNKSDEIELRVTRDRLKITSNLISQHVYWSQALTWLQSLLQTDVRLKGVSATNDGKLRFSGNASSYTVVARQIAVLLTDDRIKELSLGKISSSNDGTVEFSVELVLDLPRIIFKK